MKHGDQVKTPSGLGVYFEDKGEDKAYIVLKQPTENKIYIPLVEPSSPMWECFPCDLFNKEDLVLDKTYEQRIQEAQMAQRQAKAQRDAELAAKMRAFHEQQAKAQANNEASQQ